MMKKCLLLASLAASTNGMAARTASHTAPRPPAWRALQLPRVPIDERGNGKLYGAPPCLSTLEKVGQGHEAAWALGSLSGELPMQVVLMLDRNPDEPCCSLQFRNAVDGKKIGFLLLACEEERSALRGMWISDALRGRGLSKELLAVWLRMCRVGGLEPCTRTINKPLLSLSLTRFGFAPVNKERCMVVNVAKAEVTTRKVRDQDCRRSDSSYASSARLDGGRTAHVRTCFTLPSEVVTTVGRAGLLSELDTTVGAVLRDGVTGQDRLSLVADPDSMRRALTLRGGGWAAPAAAATPRKRATTATAPSKEGGAAAAGRMEDVASRSLLDDLRRRRSDIAEGAGRRYKVCALEPGFLNVHSEPGDPWRVDNVVGRLGDRAVVESLKESGEWVCHDGGGWSIRVYDGHAFLELLE